MTFREKLVIRILLLVARLVCEDAVMRDAIKNLATHIEVNAPAAAVALPACGGDNKR